MKLSKSKNKKLVEFANSIYPDYTGRKYFIQKWDGTEIDCTSYWDGGSRTYFKFVNVNGNILNLPETSPWKQENENRKAELIPGLCCIEHSYFCGHDCGITITMHEKDYNIIFPLQIENNY